jgi:hypothetical protein
MYWDRTTLIHRWREPVPPPPPKRTTRDESADLKAEIARLADALENDFEKGGK